MNGIAAWRGILAEADEVVQVLYLPTSHGSQVQMLSARLTSGMLQQAARLPPVPWNLSAQHALGPGQYAPQLRPTPAYTARNLPQRLDDVTLAQAGAQPATAALIGDQIDAVQRTAGPLQQSNPISVGQPTTSVLSLQNSQDNLSAFAGRQASSRSSHPDLSASLGQQGRSLLPGKTLQLSCLVSVSLAVCFQRLSYRAENLKGFAVDSLSVCAIWPHFAILNQRHGLWVNTPFQFACPQHVAENPLQLQMHQFEH